MSYVAPFHAPTLEKPSPWHLFIIDLKLVEIVLPGYLCVPYKGLPSINNIFMCTLFFFVSFIFIAHFFVGLRKPWKFFQTLFLCIHFLRSI